MSVKQPETSFAAFRELLRHARAHRLKMLLASACSVLNTLFDVMPEILIGIAIDVVVNQQNSFLAYIGVVESSSQIILLAFLTFLIWAGESLFQFLYLVLWRNLAQTVQAELRQEAYEHLQRQDMAFFDRRSSGELVSILNDDVNQLERFLDVGINAFIQTFVTVVSVGAVFFYLSPKIAFLAITPIPIIIWGAFFFLRKASPLYAEVRAQVGALATRLSNNIGGMATIKSFTAEKREAAALSAASARYVEANRQAIAVSSAFVPIIRMAILCGFLFTMVLGGLQALSGELPVGAYGVLVFMTQRLLWPLTRLAETVDLYERAMASTRRVLNLIDTPVLIRDTGTRSLPQPVKGHVRFDAVGFSYPQSGASLGEITLEVKPGTTLALVGETGAGKSTLLKLLLRFHQVDKGSISIDGVSIADLKLDSLRQAIALVSQDIYLFDGSVAENIAYARPEADAATIRKAAEAAEAWGFIEALPQGLNTTIGERGVRLSGGQRQRLSLARAILKDAPILVLDEATSAVDNETEAAFQRSLQNVSRNRTVIVVAHRLSTIRYAEQIAVLSQGQLSELGTHDELVASGGIYARQWRVQTGAPQEI